MLRPPASSRTRLPRETRSLISRSAVSSEVFVSLANFDEVSLESQNFCEATPKQSKEAIIAEREEFAPVRDQIETQQQTKARGRGS